MRADRLLSLLLLLQDRGRLTARQLAAELEVSVRTIYRDMDALSAAGIPIYADHGPGGGYALLDSYRTRLTGLTKNEISALFTLSVPAPLASLGLSQDLRGALLKLTAALPPDRRHDAERVRQRIYLDAAWWFQSAEPSPHLATLHRAIWQDRRVYIRYHPWYAAPADLERLVDPYGLVAKAGLWYLVHAYGGRVRARPVDQLLDARLAEEGFRRPEDFDLSTFWQGWSAEYERERPTFTVRVRVAANFAPVLPHFFGESIRAALASAGPADEAGRIELVLSFESLEAARARILSFGRGVEVLAPEGLRRSVIDFAEQILGLYSGARRVED